MIPRPQFHLIHRLNNNVVCELFYNAFNGSAGKFISTVPSTGRDFQQKDQTELTEIIGDTLCGTKQLVKDIVTTINGGVILIPNVLTSNPGVDVSFPYSAF
ncbi:hypothetical protein L195_g005354 [Trifolium pratense]|uniref:Uncharacterized protein n=1 Tax=Trifolium pratense TaxID=57577 RepID=A0A2K3P0K2_TRIPR|nr:hypothetical protein L195_g005354 [Trifolium pratense]